MRSRWAWACAALALPIAGPALAQSGTVVDVQQLQRTIEQQQRQLDAQQAQLDAQKAQLQAMREQAQALSAGATALDGKAATAAATVPTLLAAAEAAAPARTDTRTRAAPEAHSTSEWKGSLALQGLDTRMKISGFAETNVLHDSGAIGAQAQFITSTIVTGNAAQGVQGQTNFSVQPSRLTFETRTPYQDKRLSAFISVDLFGDALGVQPELRMRQAYGEITNILFGGDLLIGQAWTTFANLEAFPNTLDFQGPNSFFGTRQPLVRWTKGVGDGLKLKLAAETPNNHIIVGATSSTAWPDGVVSLSWHRPDVQLMGTLVARDLRASTGNGPTASTLGWGAGISGKLATPLSGKKDFATFSATYGKGVGSGFNDQPPDAVFNGANNSLDAIPAFGWFASYEHWWSEQINSTFVYGALDVNNLSIQTPDSLRKTQYASANLVWTPSEPWLFGIEVLWGQRQDFGGSSGSDWRTQLTGRFSF